MATIRLTGQTAIDYAEKHGVLLCSYTSPIEEGREDVTVQQAEAIAREDAELIYLNVEAIGITVTIPTCSELWGSECDDQTAESAAEQLGEMVTEMLMDEYPEGEVHVTVNMADAGATISECSTQGADDTTAEQIRKCVSEYIEYHWHEALASVV